MLVAVCFDIYVQGRRERGGGGMGHANTPPSPPFTGAKILFGKMLNQKT